MKLLLTSNGFTTPEISNEFFELIDKPISDIRLGMVIPNAADTEIELYYFDLHMDTFSQLGFEGKNIRIINLDDNKPRIILWIVLIPHQV